MPRGAPLEKSDRVNHDKRTDIAPFHHGIEVVRMMLKVDRLHSARGLAIGMHNNSHQSNSHKSCTA